MNIERLLQINVAALAALGTFLLGTGERSWILPTMTLFAAATSVYFTDILKWFYLNRSIANVAAVVAVIISLSGLLDDDGNYQLLAVANLLVYLQIILLYQDKNQRLYWQLIVLSLLQVVVASALNLRFEFGLLLLLYLFAALSAMFLFFLHRETSTYAPLTKSRLTSGPARQRQAKLNSGVKLRRRWPLSSSSQLQFGANYQELMRSVEGWSIVRYVSIIGVLTLILTAGLFFAIPRYGNAVWQSPANSAQSIVGFSQEVTLEEMGKILEDPQQVMRVNLFDPQTGNPLMIYGEPYFRGAVLSAYVEDNRSSKWRRARRDGLQRPGVPPRGHNLVRQVIVLEPTREPTLFAVSPAYSYGSSSHGSTPQDIRYEPRSHQLERKGAEQGPRQPYRYGLLTTAFVGGRERIYVPNEVPLDRFEIQRMQYLDFEEEQFPRLKAIADEIIADSELQDATPIRRARKLEEHFLTSRQYTYSLDFSASHPRRNADEDQEAPDPIEDFVANHRTGHCEYFASALVMMLRSQDIPARLVVGYRGGEYNSVGKYFVVRLLHAHAWVEAYIGPEHADVMKLTPSQTREGAWMRLDPTPASGDVANADIGLGILDHIRQWKDYTQLLWNEYVLGLNRDRQLESIYAPLANSIIDTGKALFSRELWWGLLERLAGLLGMDLTDWRSGQWFNWRAGLAAVVLMVITAVTFRFARQPLGTAFTWLRAQQNTRDVRSTPRVLFYDQFEALLARHGMRRSPGQTPREFAVEVGGQMADAAHWQHASSLPRRVVDAFYRVRFGAVTLDREEEEAVQQTLDNLKDIMSAEH